MNLKRVPLPEPLERLRRVPGLNSEAVEAVAFPEVVKSGKEYSF